MRCWARRDTRGERGYDGSGFAGMTGAQGRGGDEGMGSGLWLCSLAASHPPPNLPPQRGEG